MTTEEIIYELQSLAETGQGSEVTMREVEAMRAAVPILKRAEKYRAQLERIGSLSNDEDSRAAALHCLDCEAT